MKNISDFFHQDEKFPVERFHKVDFTKMHDEAECYQARLASIKEVFRIKDLDSLAKEVRNLVDDWHKMTNINEGDLRERETIIHEALLRLQPSQDWKNKYIDLFVEYIQTGDDLRVINFVQEEFNLQQIRPLGGLAAKQVLDQIKISEAVSSTEKIDNQTNNSSPLIDNQTIVKDDFSSDN